MNENIMTLIGYPRKVGLQEDLDVCQNAAEFFAQQPIVLLAQFTSFTT